MLHNKNYRLIFAVCPPCDGDKNQCVKSCSTHPQLVLGGIKCAMIYLHTTTPPPAVWNVAGVAQGVVLSCCSPSASSLTCLFGWYDWLVWISIWITVAFLWSWTSLLSLLILLWPWTSTRLVTGYFLFLTPFSVNPRNWCVCENPSRAALSEVLKSARLAQLHMPHAEWLYPFLFHFPLSFPFWCSAWTSASSNISTSRNASSCHVIG